MFSPHMYMVYMHVRNSYINLHFCIKKLHHLVQCALLDVNLKKCPYLYNILQLINFFLLNIKNKNIGLTCEVVADTVAPIRATTATKIFMIFCQNKGLSTI